jgi:hypothetical protein
MATTVNQEHSARMALTSFYSIIPVSFAVIGKHPPLSLTQHTNFPNHHATFYIGMQIFMCCYGFIIYKETPQSIRKGRRVYLICSWTILFFFSMSQIADAVEIFLLLANSSTLLEAATVLRPKLEFTWWRLVSSSGLWIGNWVGDGLLVRDFSSSFDSVIGVVTMMQKGLAMLPRLARTSMGRHHPRFHLYRLLQYVSLSLSLSLSPSPLLLPY